MSQDESNRDYTAGKRSATCYEREIGELKRQRNALLEACKLLLKTLLEAGYDPEISRVKEIADAAIAQAKK